MYRPAFTAKPRLNYEKSWARFMRILSQPALIKPAPAPAHLQEALHPQQTVKLPQLRGNLVHTAKEIFRIFIADWKAAKGAIIIAIRTTRTSIAKAGRNRDPKTGYRHIMALIEYGFILGKVHVKGGLQLLLNPALFVFDTAPSQSPASAPAGPVAAPALPTCTPAEGLAALRALAQNFGPSSRRPT